jgi:hypothetical protein
MPSPLTIKNQLLIAAGDLHAALELGEEACKLLKVTAPPELKSIA